MDTGLLFERGKIGKLETKNRLILSPITTNMSTADGEVTDELIEFYVKRAQGGVGTIVLEATRTETRIQPASITGINLRLDNPSFIGGLSRLAEAVHECGAKIFIQLSMGQGSHAPPEMYPEGSIPNSVSGSSSSRFVYRNIHVLTAEEIERLIEAFGEAANRSRMAGFDGINIHGQGMYLLSQFMSPFTNKRTDEYGDPAALPLKLIKAVKSLAGDDYPIMFRWSINEFLPGGRTLELSQANGRQFEQAGIHAVHVSGGNFWVPGGVTHGLPPMSFSHGHLRPYSRGMREAVKIPVILTGKIKDPFLANKLLADGDADFIGMSRVLVCDPEWPNKVAEGRFEDILPCISDNEGCEVRMASFRPIRCTVNYHTGRERECNIQPVLKPKEVLVVGGGPGGMEAARVAALRGHKVTLYEKSDKLGGRLNLASMIPDKGEFNLLTDYLINQISKLGVKVVLDKEVTSELVGVLKPDAVILATGARPLIPPIPGVNKKNVFIADDIVTGNAEVTGENIIIVGGGFVGLDTGLLLAQEKKKKVTIIEQFSLEAIGAETHNTNYMDLFHKLDELGVQLIPETVIEQILDSGVEVITKDGEKQKIAADSVVLATGGVCNKELEEVLKGRVSNVRLIGDCAQVGKVINTISSGFRAAFDL